MSHSSFAIATLLSWAATPVAATKQLPPTASFPEYARFFGRTYDHESEEGRLRRLLFEERAHAVRKHNEKSDARWKAGLNPYTDWTHQELSGLRGWKATAMPHNSGGHRGSGGHGGLSLMAGPGAKLDRHKQSGGHDHETALPDDFPESKDWTSLKSVVVPNQGMCGSCWAVATTFLLRAHYEIQTNKVKEFSVQAFVNCVNNPDECGGTGGCGGATVELALAYVQNVSLAKVPVNTELPYNGMDGECPSGASLLATSAGRKGLRNIRKHGARADASEVELSSFKTLPSNKPVPLLLALLDGPVAVSVAASQWFAYSEGIFDGCTGNDGWVIDHAVLMVAFGVDAESGNKYWKIMNSWGPEWGESGMMRILRGTPKEDSELCDWDNKPGDGIECKPYPKKVWACGMCGILYDSVSPQLG